MSVLLSNLLLWVFYCVDVNVNADVLVVGVVVVDDDDGTDADAVVAYTGDAVVAYTGFVVDDIVALAVDVTPCDDDDDDEEYDGYCYYCCYCCCLHVIAVFSAKFFLGSKKTQGDDFLHFKGGTIFGCHNSWYNCFGINKRRGT
jgi:hypothetical protein